MNLRSQVARAGVTVAGYIFLHLKRVAETDIEKERRPNTLLSGRLIDCQTLFICTRQRLSQISINFVTLKYVDFNRILKSEAEI